MNTISEQTSIKLGLVISCVIVFASAVWWASGVSSKLDTLVTSSIKVEAEQRVLRDNLADLESRVRLLEGRYYKGDVK
jgi:hypothetical protein